MRYLSGDLWHLAHELDGWVVVPTNTTIRQDGNAVMGAGVAKDAAERYPELSRQLARHIRRFDDGLYLNAPVICMPTKRNWRSGSQLDLIEMGCHRLVELARVFDMVDHDCPIFLPKIGCGLGGLNWERQVRPVVDSLLGGDRFVLVSKDD